MAKSTQAQSTSVSAERVRQIWIEKIFREQIVESYFMPRFASEAGNNIIHVKNDLAKTRGDRMNFAIRFKLSGSGVTSGQTLEGNEESLSDAGFTMVLEQYRHAVRDDGAMTRQRKMYDIDAEARQAIADWGAEKIDQLAFDALDAGTGAMYFWDDAGTYSFTQTEATAEATITKLTPDFISWMRVAALTGRNRTFNPVKPVKVDGREYLILLVHPDVRHNMASLNFSNSVELPLGQYRAKSERKGVTTIWEEAQPKIWSELHGNMQRRSEMASRSYYNA